jgi:hypothetical protein
MEVGGTMSTESPKKNPEESKPPIETERKLIIAMVPRPKKPKEHTKPS